MNSRLEAVIYNPMLYVLFVFLFAQLYKIFQVFEWNWAEAEDEEADPGHLLYIH